MTNTSHPQKQATGHHNRKDPTNPQAGRARSWHLRTISRKETIHLNQRNHPRDTPDQPPQPRTQTKATTIRPTHPADEVKLGIDFWHAVEFSKNRRTPTNNHHQAAARRGNVSILCSRLRGVKFADAIHSTQLASARAASDSLRATGGG